MTLTERLEPVLDYFTKFHYKTFIGSWHHMPQYRELTFLQRLGMWTGIACTALVAVLAGMFIAAMLYAFAYMVWTTAPGVVLFLGIMLLIVAFLAWKVKL